MTKCLNIIEHGKHTYIASFDEYTVVVDLSKCAKGQTIESIVAELEKPNGVISVLHQDAIKVIYKTLPADIKEVDMGIGQLKPIDLDDKEDVDGPWIDWNQKQIDLFAELRKEIYQEIYKQYKEDL